MATLVEVSCPNCKKALKVPPAVFGKKVKCKHCEHPFVVKDPDEKAAAKPAKPGAKPEPAASPPPAAAKKPYEDDDEGAQNIDVIRDDDEARCPHCAKVLEPPDAVVCIHCGFNNVTRAKAETKKVWAPGAEDWAMHLGPGIIALVACVGLIVFNIIAFIDMREWLAGSFLEMDEKDAAGRQRYYVHPRAFNFLLLAITGPILLFAGRFAYRRLAKDYIPPEQIKK